MTTDVKDIQTEVVGETTTTPATETVASNPEDVLMEKLLAKLQPMIDSKVEEGKRHFQSIADRDVKKAVMDARKFKREADTLREVVNGIPADPETQMKIKLARFEAEERSKRQFDQEDEIERQRTEFEGRFEQNASQFVAEMGLDIKDPRLDWGKDSQDYLERMSRIQKSVAKITKEERTKADSKQKVDAEEIKQSLRKELGLDSISTEQPRSGSGRIYTTEQIKDPVFWAANRDDILKARTEGRIK